MGFSTDAWLWSQEVFGGCDLGDPRRVNGLIAYAAQQACAPGESTSAAMRGDKAAAESAYRLLRNDSIRPEDIDEGAFDHTVSQMKARGDILAIQDTTTVAVAHRDLIERVNAIGCPDGYLVHSTLAVQAATGVPLGLLDQCRWLREKKRPGKKTRHQRPYEEKESYKWESADLRIASRVVDLSQVIMVGDREADVIDYLYFKTVQNQRFIVRSSTDRLVVDTTDGRTVREVVGSQAMLGTYSVHVSQRGPMKKGFRRTHRPGRKARTAKVELRSATVTLKLPPRLKAAERVVTVTVNAVWVHEPNPPKDTEALDWLLLTTEQAATFAEARMVARYYERRWSIEDFHKAWKVGCNIERRPLQSFDNVERMLAITAPIAVRLLQLSALREAAPETPCDECLSEDEWRCLYAITMKRRRVPEDAPSIAWAYETLARLGGWADTKRTGRAGWQALWKGYERLEDALNGWRAARSTGLGSR